MGLPNQGNTKLRKKLSCPQGVNFSRKFTLGMLLLTRTQEKKNEETFFCLFVFKMFFLSLVHCHIFQVIFYQLADKTLLLSKMDLWCFFFIYYFPFLFKFYRVNSLESRGHNRLYFSSRPWREVTQKNTIIGVIQTRLPPSAFLAAKSQDTQRPQKRKVRLKTPSGTCEAEKHVLKIDPLHQIGEC